MELAWPRGVNKAASFFGLRSGGSGGSEEELNVNQIREGDRVLKKAGLWGGICLRSRLEIGRAALLHFCAKWDRNVWISYRFLPAAFKTQV